MRILIAIEPIGYWMFKKQTKNIPKFVQKANKYLEQCLTNCVSLTWRIPGLPSFRLSRPKKTPPKSIKSKFSFLLNRN